MELVFQFLGEASIDTSHAVFIGTDLCKKYQIRFHGTPGLTANRVAKFKNSPRAHGILRAFTVPFPTGVAVPIFFSEDKNSKTIKIEIETKRVAVIVREMYPQISWHANRAEGILSVDWEEVLNIFPQPEKT